MAKKINSELNIQENFNDTAQRFWYTFGGLKFNIGKNQVRLFGSGENPGFGVDTQKGKNGTPFHIGQNNCLEFDISGLAPGEIKIELTDFNNNVESINFSINSALPHQKLLLNKVKNKVSKIQMVFPTGKIDVKISALGFSKASPLISRIFIPTLAFDIGTTSIKMALVDNHQNPLLLDYQEIPPVETEETRQNEIMRILRGLIFKHKLKANHLSFVISDPLIAQRRILVKNKEKREEWLKFFQKELANIIPFPSENNFIAYHKNNKDENDFFVAVVPNNIVRNYQDLLKKLNLSSKFALDNSQALLNIYQALYPDTGLTTAIVDIGARKTDLVITQDNSILFSRHIKIGGNTFTKHLADTLNISISKAEKIKKEAIAPGSKESNSLQETSNLWSTDLQRTLEYYANENQNPPLQKIVLCGGGSLLSGLIQLVQEKTGINTESFQNTNLPLKNKISKAIQNNTAQASLFAAVLGLALEKIDENSTYNLLKSQASLPKKTPTKQLLNRFSSTKKSIYDWKFFQLDRKIRISIISGILAFFLLILPAFILLRTKQLKKQYIIKREAYTQLEATASSANIRMQNIREAENTLSAIQKNRKNRSLQILFNNFSTKSNLELTQINFVANKSEFIINGQGKDQWSISKFVSKLQSLKSLANCNLIYTKKKNNLLAFKIQGYIKD